MGSVDRGILCAGERKRGRMVTRARAQREEEADSFSERQQWRHGVSVHADVDSISTLMLTCARCVIHVCMPDPR